MQDSEEGISIHNDMSPENTEFVIKVRNLVDSDPDLLGDKEIMKFVKLALFKASKNESRREIAKELDEELSGYLVKDKFNAPSGVRKLQEELKHYTTDV